MIVKQVCPLRVLVVEDDIDTADSMAQLLRLESHDAGVAYNGPAGVHICQSWHPDVVLLDIDLPGVDGWQVAALVNAELDPRRKNKRKAPLLVAVTGFGSEKDRLRSFAVGIHLHLVKPVDPELLLALLRRFETVLA